VKTIWVEQTERSSEVSILNLGQDVIQQEDVAVPLENMDIWSIADELLKSGYLIFLEVDQKVLSERWADYGAHSRDCLE